MTETNSEHTVPYKRPDPGGKTWGWMDTRNLLLLLLLGLGLRLWNVTQPAELYFDEIYYVDAAQKLWAGEPDPNSVHPPLGKWLIGAGVEGSKAVLGEDVNEQFSWRISAVIAGVLMVGATYCFSLTLFPANRVAAFAASFVVATEHLHLSMSRIAMLDPFLALFCLVGAWWSFAYFLGGHERWAVLGAFSLGVATGCKWSGLFTAFGCLIACFFLQRYRDMTVENRTTRYFFWLLLMLPLGFFLCYSHLFLADGLSLETFEKIFNQGERMVKFRYDPEQFVHGYKSQFWQWPLVLRPIWLHYEQEGQIVEGVCSLGVWPIWWLFTILLIERAFTGIVKRKDLIAGALVLLWFGQWIPWIVSKTGGFFYYMLPEVPIMALLMGKFFSDFGNFEDVLGEDRWRAWIIAFVYVSSALVYLPFALNLHVSRQYFDLLFFLPGWI